MNTAHNAGVRRRHTHAVRVGNTAIGGDNPIRVQSMTNTPTLDTDASVRQCQEIAAAGADIVRLTAQGVSHARNLGVIRGALRDSGCDIPLVADIHFNPAAAFEAAGNVEKVRINPGNFVDPGRVFKHIDYTDDEYAAELRRLEDKLVPFLNLCREKGTAIRIGVNHGSLSDRIMSRYGDTPAGMVESALEFLRVCRDHDFGDVVISIKASNVTVMVETVRMLCDALDREGMSYPLHLGVTEAGNGEDGRVKSAVGIGTLLAEGIGDTIRVSLSENPANEIPVARSLIQHIGTMEETVPRLCRQAPQQPPVVVGYDIQPDSLDGYTVLDGRDGIAALKRRLAASEEDGCTIVRLRYPDDMSAEDVVLAASVDFGTLLLDGWCDGIWLETASMSRQAINSLCLSILQATRRRFSHTEYIACPGCGRTLFDLEKVLADVRKATSHLTGLKIGVMGCIVNGPGEMADADYGYVGAAAGHVSLYRNKECVRRNIPASEAIPALIALIKENGDWHDPE